MTVIMLLSGIDLCKDQETAEPAKTELTASGKGKTENRDACSPFCTCAHCPFSILLPEAQSAAESFHLSMSNYGESPSGSPNAVSTSIWQPPKTV